MTVIDYRDSALCELNGVKVLRTELSEIIPTLSIRGAVRQTLGALHNQFEFDVKVGENN